MIIFIRVLALILFIVHNFACSPEENVVITKVCQGEHFEGPHWSSDDNSLYWLDISEQKVYRLEMDTMNIINKTIDRIKKLKDSVIFLMGSYRQSNASDYLSRDGQLCQALVNSKEINRALTGYGPVSLAVSIKDNPTLGLVAVRSELYIMNWESFKDDRSLKLLSIVDLGLPDNRINDGKVDAKGRLWFGTMGREVGHVLDADLGSLYMIDQHNYLNPKVMVRPVSISNGIAWTADNKYMFYIDTPTRNIDVFDFDLETGLIGNRTTFFSFKENEVTGSPDGLTIDSEDNLFVACYNGGKVLKIDSRTSRILNEYILPAEAVTSVMFGGPDLSTLFVTTSCRDLSQEERKNHPDAGALFTIEGTGSKGLPQYPFIFPNAPNY